LQPNLPPNSGGNGVLNNYSDCHGHIHTNAYGDSYIYAYGYSHGNCDSNADRDAVAAAYTYATASADTAASALALSGIEETREKQLASSQLQIYSKSLTNEGRALYKEGGLHLEVVETNQP
jgi:hypothetical protein